MRNSSSYNDANHTRMQPKTQEANAKRADRSNLASSKYDHMQESWRAGYMQGYSMSKRSYLYNDRDKKPPKTSSKEDVASFSRQSSSESREVSQELSNQRSNFVYGGCDKQSKYDNYNRFHKASNNPFASPSYSYSLQEPYWFSSTAFGCQGNEYQTRRFFGYQNHERSQNAMVNEGKRRDYSKPWRREKMRQKDERSMSNDLSLSVCHRSDYDKDSEWFEIKLRCLLKGSSNERNVYISMSEPVISYLIPESSKIPHYHISPPFYTHPYQVGRKMIPIKHPDNVNISNKDCFDFTVLSYNVLADKLLKDNYRLYEGYPEWVLDWDYRKINLMKEIITYDADVICLQEVQEKHITEFYLPFLEERGYLGLYKQRTGGKPDGCAVFYKENQFDYLASRFLEFRRKGHQVMNRDNVAVIVALKPKKSTRKTPIFIANTHLLFNKNRGDIKLLQLATLFAEVDDIASEFSNDTGKATDEDVLSNPLIICGDFNSVPFSPVYNFLANGHLRYRGESRMHLSGQNSPTKRPTESSFINYSLIPEDLGITDFCQKRDTRIECFNDAVMVEQSDNGTGGNVIGEKAKDGNNMWEKVREGMENDREETFVEEDVSGDNFVSGEPGVLKHLLNLQSVYSHTLDDGRQEISTCHTEGCLCVDYIFYSQGMQKSLPKNDDVFKRNPRKILYPTQLLSLLGSEEVIAMGRLPNILLSSDHIALLAGFRLLLD